MRLVRGRGAKHSVSPIDAATARRILDYNRQVFGRFVRRVRHLKSSLAHEQLEIGHQSLFQTLVHVLNVWESWLLYVVRGRASSLPERWKDAERRPTDWAGFDAYADPVWTAITTWANQIDDGGLRKVVKAPWMPGVYTVGDAILQCTFEEAHHLGEVIGALWQKDLPSVDMTWIEVNRRPS